MKTSQFHKKNMYRYSVRPILTTSQLTVDFIVGHSAEVRDCAIITCDIFEIERIGVTY